MINIRLSSNASQHGKAEIHIDYHNVNILFTVIEGGREFDFSLNLQEWELLKKFIELQIETKNKSKQ